jgi:peptidoglycan/xylan/chitin deacetylase (PgdA/CDA1 family)
VVRHLCALSVSLTLTLTFDDGPEPVWSTRVAEELQRCSAHATFFLVGERVRQAPDQARAIVASGNEAQLHCHRHIRHSELSEAEIEQDTRKALCALAAVGVRPTSWRTPWGVRTADTLRVARRHRLRLVHWTIDTHDWRGDTAEQMLMQAHSQLATGGVVLMHDGLGPGSRRNGCENTVELIGPLLDAARSEGLELAPVSLGTGARR